MRRVASFGRSIRAALAGSAGVWRVAIGSGFVGLMVGLAVGGPGLLGLVGRSAERAFAADDPTGAPVRQLPDGRPVRPGPATPPRPVGKPKRPTAAVATELEDRLTRFESARARHDSGQQDAVRRDMDRVSEATLDDVASQLNPNTTLVYWAASIMRGAAATGDDAALERARRYLTAARAVERGVH